MLGLLLLLGLFVAMYAAQAMLYTRYGMRRLSYRCRFDRTEVEEGEELCLIEEIENSGFLPMPWVKSEYSVSRHLDFAGTHSVVTGDTRFVSSLFFLRSHTRICRQWKVRAMQRGEYRVRQVLLVSSDLLGAVRDSRAAEDLGGVLTVLPKPFADLPTLPPVQSRTMGELPAARSLLTDPLTVADIRPYTGCEPLRRLDWNALARTGELLVRTEEPVQEQRLCVLFTAQHSEYGKRFISREVCEHTIRVTAAVCQYFTSRGEPFSLQSNCTVHGDALSIPEGCTADRYHSILRQIAALELEPEQNLRQAAPTGEQLRLLLIAPYLSEDVRRLMKAHPDAVLLLTAPGETGDIPFLPVYAEK